MTNALSYNHEQLFVCLNSFIVHALMLLALPTNITLTWKWLTGINTLAYTTAALITIVKYLGKDTKPFPLGWKWLTRINTLAYTTVALITIVKYLGPGSKAPSLSHKYQTRLEICSSDKCTGLQYFNIRYQCQIILALPANIRLGLNRLSVKTN